MLLLFRKPGLLVGAGCCNPGACGIGCALIAVELLAHRAQSFGDLGDAGRVLL
jgi:hypothetical protein